MNDMNKQERPRPIFQIGLLVVVGIALLVFYNRHVHEEELARQAAEQEAWFEEIHAAIEAHLNSFGLDDPALEAFAAGDLVGIYKFFSQFDGRRYPNQVLDIMVDDWRIRELFCVREDTEEQQVRLVETFHKEVSLSFAEMTRSVSDFLKQRLVEEATPYFDDEVSEETLLRPAREGVFPEEKLKVRLEQNLPEILRLRGQDISIDLDKMEIIAGYDTSVSGNQTIQIPRLDGFMFAVTLKNETTSPINIRSGTAALSVGYIASLEGKSSSIAARTGDIQGQFSVGPGFLLRPGESRKAGTVSFRLGDSADARSSGQKRLDLLRNSTSPEQEEISRLKGKLSGEGNYSVRTTDIMLVDASFSGNVYDKDAVLKESDIQQLAHQLRYCRVMDMPVSDAAHMPQAVDATFQKLMSELSKAPMSADELAAIRAKYLERVGTRKADVHRFMNTWLVAFKASRSVPDFDQLIHQFSRDAKDPLR